MDQGCASGLAGTANSSTAEAPMGAMNQTLDVPSTWRLSQSVHSSPRPTPRLLSQSSPRPMASGAG